MVKIIKDKISVIIRSKNEERWIGHAIQSVIDNFYKPEIIIVDNYSSDATLEIVKTFNQANFLENKENKNEQHNGYTKIKIKNIKDYSPGRALNMGVKESSNDIILILSAHCVINKINFNDIKKNLNKFSSIFGNQIPVWNGKKIVKRYVWSNFINKKVVNMYSSQESRYFFHNAAAFYKKNFLKKNLFNEDLTSKEDRYWANKIIKKNKKILYDPSFSVFHYYTENGNTWKGIG